VTITGTAFRAGATVTVGGTAATGVTVVNATTITATTPAHAAGAADIVVTNSDSQTETLAAGFTFYAAPTVTAVSPASGPTTGSTAVTITGTGFQPGATVSVGGTAATSVTVVDATTITATTPAQAAGAADVVVTNSDSQAGTLAGGFTFYVAPTLSSVSPASGPAAGGTTVTITGTAFQPGATVSVGGTAATSVTVVDATTITATTAAHAAGAVDVVVTNSDSQTVTLAGGFSYLDPRHYYLAEGATAWTFETELMLLNPGGQPAPVTVTFLKQDGSSVETTRTVAAGSRDTLRVADVPGMTGVSFGTIVTSTDGVPLAVERLMTWDGGHGAHSGTATEALATSWYFAEGAQNPLDTFLVVANPGDVAADLTVTFMLAGAQPVVRTVTVDPRRRATLWAGSVPELQSRSFSMVVQSSQPVVAERSMYFGAARTWDGGTSAMGVSAPSVDWYFAEGSTGPVFDMYLLLGNPNADPANVNVTYLLADGTRIPKSYVVGGQQRYTAFVPAEAPELANAGGVGVELHADQPVVAERVMYWLPGYANWRDGHATFGSPATGTEWAAVGGMVGGVNAADSFLLVANPGGTSSEVQVTYLRENGLPPVVKTYTVGSGSRLTVWVNSVTELSNERVGAVVSVTSGSGIVVEWSMYWSIGSDWWAAGTSALAKRIR
jgi:hypothetical protein